MLEVDTEGVPVKVNPPRVTVTMGFTRNMGNFESMRIDLGVEASAREGESVATAFSRVYDFVEAKLVEKFSETEAALSDKGLGQEG